MNRLAWLLGSGALVAWGFAGALGGCGSSDAVINDSNVDGGEAGSGTSGGTSGNPGTDGGGGTDGSTDGSTGGSDGATKEAGSTAEGGASTPNKVPCGGATSCTTPAEACCVTGGAGGGDAGCQPAADSCSGAKLRCDEKADCTGGDICCGGFGVGTSGTECKAGTCSGNQVQVCKTNAECTGGTCFVNTCPSFGGGTIVIQSCSKLPAPCTQ